MSGQPQPVMATEPVTVLSMMIEAVAQAGPSVQACLALCQSCRNRVLYAMDTVPYADAAAGRYQIEARLRALPDVHRYHGDGSDGDKNPPRIRWITP